ncbi:hypothetical protein FHG87_006869 [Trinorchestia longiramus]|nr:hypothetical protein FHG87_006869 [Trinorchestia longiramus]
MGIFSKYKYEDYPDGTHCVYKTACITRDTTLFGMVIGMFDVINISKPSNIGGVLVRLPRYVVPGFCTGLVFGLTTCTLTQVRKKDDHYNYMWGGAAAGAVMGACKRSFAVGTPCTVLFALIGVLYKEARLNDFVFFPKVNHCYGSYDTYFSRSDFTLTPDRPKYTGQDPEESV